MAASETVVIRTFADRPEALAHFLLRAGESPRFMAFDDVAGCPVDTALAALEWTRATGLIPDDDLVHAARLTAETGAVMVERRTSDGRRYLFLGPRLEAPLMDVLEGRVVFDEPGVKVLEFVQRGHALGHFFRATGGDGVLLSSTGRRAPELRHLRRWFGPIVSELDGPAQLVAGWFAVGAGGALFSTGIDATPMYRYIEAGLES